MNGTASLIEAYFRQQSQLDMPDYFFSKTFDITDFEEKPRRTLPAKSQPIKPDVKPVSRPAVFPVKSGRLPLRADQLCKTGVVVNDAGITEGKRSLLAKLFRETKTCRQCGLCGSRVNVVFGSGNAEAVFLVIGRTPGEEDDAQGLPFSGAAGEILAGMLASAGIDRKKQAFVTDIVKCRTPSDRQPEESEISACMKILDRQMKIHNPKVILLLGKTVAQVMLDMNSGIDDLRADTHSYKGIPAFVTYHPSEILLDSSLRGFVREDMTRLKKPLEEAGAYDITSK
jgi:DNA polymerase